MNKIHLSCLALALTVAIRAVIAQEDQPSSSPDPTTEPSPPEVPTTTTTPRTTTTTTTSATTTTTTPKPSTKPNKSNSKSKADGGQTVCPVDCSCVDRKITCNDKKLISIPNLSKFVNYTSISLRSNSIQQLDFNMLPIASLESLDLYNNTIKLIIPGNKKSDSMPKLKVLNLGLNQIGNLTNSWVSWKFPVLENLDLSYNPIENLEPQSLNSTKNLQVLRIDQTKLKSIQEPAFSSLTQLNSLNMSGAKLSDHLGDRAFASNQKLEFLDLTDNNLIEVPFALRSTSSLKTLILNENLMTSLRQSDFINRSGLINLEIRACPKLTKIDEFTFSDLDNLKKLIIADNPQLRHISRDVFKSDRPHKLDIFDLTGNNITTMSNPLEFPSVTFEKILLSNNPWDCNCDLNWLQFINQKSTPIHCKTPEKFRDIEISQYFLSTDCEADSSYHSIVVTGFLIFLLVLMLAVFVQRSEVCRRWPWKDQYGTIYYTKASFPPETV